MDELSDVTALCWMHRTLKWRRWHGSIDIDYEGRTLKWSLTDNTVGKGRPVNNAMECSGRLAQSHLIYIWKESLMTNLHDALGCS